MLPRMIAVSALVVGLLGPQTQYVATISMRGDSAEVSIQTALGPRALYHMMVRAGQRLRWTTPGVSVDSGTGVLAVVPTQRRFGYSVLGGVDRIPLPVPVEPMPQERRTVQLRVLGLSPAAALDWGFPRLTWAGDTAKGLVRDVPSLVHLDLGLSWSVSLLSEVLVILVVGAASVGWVIHRYRSAGG